MCLTFVFSRPGCGKKGHPSPVGAPGMEDGRFRGSRWDPGVGQWDTREALPVADGAWDPAWLSASKQGAQGRGEGSPWQREEHVGWPKWGSTACPRTWQRVSLIDWRRGPGDAWHCHPRVRVSNRVGGCAHKDPPPALCDSIRPKQRRPRTQGPGPGPGSPAARQWLCPASQSPRTWRPASPSPQQRQ